MRLPSTSELYTETASRKDSEALGYTCRQVFDNEAHVTCSAATLQHVLDLPESTQQIVHLKLPPT